MLVHIHHLILDIITCIFITCSSLDIENEDQVSEDMYKRPSTVSLENTIAVACTPIQKKFLQSMVYTSPKLEVSRSMVHINKERSSSLCWPTKLMHSSSLTLSPSVAKRRHNNLTVVNETSHSMSYIFHPSKVSQIVKPENEKQNSNVSSDSSSSRASDKPLEGIPSVFTLFN